MKQIPKMGDNKTGIASASERAREMVDGTREFGPSSKGNGQGVARELISYAEEKIAYGHVPPPLREREKATDAMVLLMDKIGARLAFERTGTRLYEGLLAKHQAFGGFDGGPSLEDLDLLREQEKSHVAILLDAMRELGGDFTAMTPSAAVEGTLGMGAGKIIGDPRINLVQSLEAILVAELADHESWEALVELARDQGHGEIADRFDKCLDEEEEHLEKARRWLAAAEGRKGITKH